MIREFNKCPRCQETNTQKIWLGGSDIVIVYVGWCDTCNREYSYRERIVDVYDKENRI